VNQAVVPTEKKAPLTGRFSLAPPIAWVGGLLLLLSWLTTEHFLPWVSWHSEAVCFFGVMLVAWMGLFGMWRARPRPPIDVPYVVLPFLLIGAVALAQALTGVMTFTGDALVAWFYLALCIACLVMGFNLGLTTPGPSAGGAAWSPATFLAWVFVLGASASVVVAFAQVFDLWGDSAWILRTFDLRRPGGNLAQPNQLGTLILMGTASVTCLYALGRLGPLAAGAILVLLGAGLAATESRAAVLALIVLLAWWQLKRPRIAAHVPGWTAPVVFAVFIALFFAWPQVLNALALTGNAESRFANGDVRLAMWSQLAEVALQRPWAGWGILEVAKALNSVAHAHPVNNPFSYSHNVILDWAVWMGIPVAVILTVAAAVWLRRRLAQADSLLAWYSLAIALPLATHSLLEFPYAYAYFLAPVLLLLGMLERHVAAAPLLRIPAVPVAAALAVASAAMLWSAVEYLSIEEDFRIVRFEQLRIGHTPADHHRPQVVLFDQLGALLEGSRNELRAAMPKEDLEALKKLALRYPWVATEYRYAVALALNGQQQEAVRQFQVIRWTRDEKLYVQIKKELADMAQTRHPELRTLQLP